MNLNKDSRITPAAPGPGSVDTGHQVSADLSTERQKTDDSLRQERDKTDQAVAAKQADLERRAETVVDQARDASDAMQGVARDDADAALHAARSVVGVFRPSHALDAVQAVFEKEREVADAALHAERENADEVLKGEREAHAATLRGFLPLERESTDQSLRSERISADEALLNRDEFLAIVAHDLRDLLGGIALSSNVLASRAKQDPAGANTLAETVRIGRYVARMGRLIGDLVDIASVDAGKLSVAPTPGNLAVLISEVTETFQAAAEARGIGLESRVSTMLDASFDHQRILQVLGNLVSNSLKYTPHGGTITLAGERDSGMVVLTVSDTGSGIPEGALESVFERFSQEGPTTHGGLGLGLYISRCLVEAHGGSIRAERIAGAGTRICVRLPVDASREQSTSP